MRRRSIVRFFKRARIAAGALCLIFIVAAAIFAFQCAKVQRPPKVRSEASKQRLPVTAGIKDYARDEVGAYERDLALALKTAGYRVLNTVNCKWFGDPAHWIEIRAAFAQHFPRLAETV